MTSSKLTGPLSTTTCVPLARSAARTPVILNWIVWRTGVAPRVLWWGVWDCGVECESSVQQIRIYIYISAPDGVTSHSIPSPYASPSISAARGTSRAKVRPPIRRHDGEPKLISPSVSSTQHIPFPHVTRNSKMERHGLGSFTPPRLLALAPSSSFPLLPLGMIAPSLPARSSHNGRTSGAHQ